MRCYNSSGEKEERNKNRKTNGPGENRKRLNQVSEKIDFKIMVTLPWPKTVFSLFSILSQVYIPSTD